MPSDKAKNMLKKDAQSLQGCGKMGKLEVTIIPIDSEAYTQTVLVPP